MADLTVSATFTKNSGQPATLLTLTDINIRLTAQNRSTGVDTVIWNTQNPTVEIDNVGAYIRIYTGANLDTYNYFAAAEYVGVTVLDTNWALGVASLNDVPIGTAKERTYVVTDSANGEPLEGVRVWMYIDSAATDNIAWSGVTDTFGVARDSHFNLPRLDNGTYYIKVYRPGYTPDDFIDVETFS